MSYWEYLPDDIQWLIYKHIHMINMQAVLINIRHLQICDACKCPLTRKRYNTVSKEVSDYANLFGLRCLSLCMCLLHEKCEKKIIVGISGIEHCDVCYRLIRM